jgi:hypothetical protein
MRFPEMGYSAFVSSSRAESVKPSVMVLPATTMGLRTRAQLLAVETFRLRPPFGSDEMLGPSHPRREDPQFVRGKRLLDEVPELYTVVRHLLREKLPRFHAARSTGLPVERYLGRAFLHWPIL